jgi:hypothetical protein
LADAPKFCRMLKSTVIIQTGLEKYAAALKWSGDLCFHFTSWYKLSRCTQILFLFTTWWFEKRNGFNYPWKGRLLTFDNGNQVSYNSQNFIVGWKKPSKVHPVYEWMHMLNCILREDLDLVELGPLWYGTPDISAHLSC